MFSLLASLNIQYCSSIGNCYPFSDHSGWIFLFYSNNLTTSTKITAFISPIPSVITDSNFVDYKISLSSQHIVEYMVPMCTSLTGFFRINTTAGEILLHSGTARLDPPKSPSILPSPSTYIVIFQPAPTSRLPAPFVSLCTPMLRPSLYCLELRS